MRDELSVFLKEPLLFSAATKDTVRAAGLGAVMRGVGMVTRFIPIPQPTLLVGPGSSGRLGQAVAGFGHSKILIVTDSIISKLGLLTPLTDALTAGGAEFVVFDEITPDAPIPLIEKAIEFYQSNGCDAIVAFGGGSSMDASKAIAVSVANPGKSLRALAGYLKGLRSPVKIYAVPTTAGTGSEVTVAAVIADPANQRKLVIVDPRMVPKMAALDPSLMTGLPPHITAATGIDALTHAVEAFIGNWKTPYSDGMALSAVGLIFENLRTAYTDGKNLAAREKMAWPPPMPALPSPAPTWATCMPSRTSSAACTTRRTAWPTRSCCPTCCGIRARPSRPSWPSWRCVPGWAARTSPKTNWPKSSWKPWSN